MLFLLVREWWPGFRAPRRTQSGFFYGFVGLTKGLDTENWRAYERREEPNGVRLVLSIDTASVTMLEGLRWRPFSSVRQAVFSLLGVKPGGKK
jgi:hypothetical protein